MIFDYDIYRDELRALGFGLPLYEPNPSGYDRVRIGDVGLVTHYGGFLRIFNVFYGEDHPINAEFGVPDDFEPVTDSKYKKENNLSEIAAESRLMSQHVTSIEISTSASLQGLGPLISVIEPGVSVKFKSSKSNAAALLLPNGAVASIAVRTAWFRQYAKKHCRSWCNHARANDLDLRHQNIMFVTGHHLTDRWATAVVRGSEVQSDSGVGVTSPFAGASFSVRRTETRELQAPLRIGPSQGIEPNAANVAFSGINGDSLIEMADRTRSYGRNLNQCIFLRGFHIVERKIRPISIKAAAEAQDPHSDLDGDKDPCFGISSTESDPDVSDNLTDTLLEMMTEELFTTSSSDIYLIDEDVFCQHFKHALQTKSDLRPVPALMQLCDYRLDENLELKVAEVTVHDDASEEMVLNGTPPSLHDLKLKYVNPAAADHDEKVLSAFLRWSEHLSRKKAIFFKSLSQSSPVTHLESTLGTPEERSADVEV